MQFQYDNNIFILFYFNLKLYNILPLLEEKWELLIFFLEIH